MPTDAVRPFDPSAPARYPADDKIQRTYQSPAPDTTTAAQAQAGTRSLHDALADAVLLPRADQALAPEWQPIDNLLGFARALFDTAREHRDNTLATMPGYRERIVQIRFDKTEGGMNLAMDPETIARIVAKGTKAGVLLRDEFDFDQHRWTRFLGLMGELERQLAAMRRAYIQAEYPHLLRDKIPTPVPPATSAFPYPRPPAWREQAIQRTEQLLALVEGWENADHPGILDAAPSDLFAPGAYVPPQPSPVLQAGPHL
jgi:hypothetical protein